MHVGIILDGNRRWAHKRGLPSSEGHKQGYKIMKDFVNKYRQKYKETKDPEKEYSKEIEKFNECKEKIGLEKADELTLYALSTENLKRSKEELDPLFDLFREIIRDFEEQEFTDQEKEEMNKVKVNFVGNLHLLPEDIRQKAENLKTEGDKILNICVAYGGRDEIVKAFNKAIEKGEKVSEESFKELLEIKSEPDFIIRTGGKKRISNFLPYQSVYSELFFTETLWPDFTEEEMESIFDKFSEIKRNFGK